MKNRREQLYAKAGKAGKRGGTAAVKGPGCAGEIGGIVLSLLVLGLFISVASYAPDDPPNATGAAKNLCGTIGAYLAYGLMLSFGYGSYLVILWIAMAAYRRFQPALLIESVLEGAGFVLGILGLTLLLSRFSPMLGGTLGYFLSVETGRWLGNWGSTLGALGALLCALVLTTRFSVRDLAHLAGAGTIFLWKQGLDAGGEMFQQVKERWSERRDRLTEKTAARPKIRVTDPSGRGKDRPAPAGDGKITIFPTKTGPQIQQPEKAATVEPGTAGGNVVSIKGKRDEKAAAAAAAAAAGESAPGAGRDGIAAGSVMGEGYDPDAYQLPGLDLFDDPPPVVQHQSEEDLKAVADKLVQTLQEFGIEAACRNIIPGPVVTMYELIPAPGTAVNKFLNRENDLKLALAVKSLRIVAPIPGKPAVGIEVPNPTRQIIAFKEIALTRKYHDCGGLLKAVLGKDIVGEPYHLELDKMPHLLIGGQTGSGKSVCVHTLICSLLTNAKPHELKFVLVDPKMVEGKRYEKLPHLLAPVIYDAKDATRALKWLCAEMDSRFETLSAAGSSEISRYNLKMREQGRPVMPYVVVIIDELADLMMIGAQECETYIHRLTAKARAIGIHLVLATQRPSVDVITGTIKANLPARIAFAVLSSIDSRTILDSPGAENLLGKGDMLYQDPGSPVPVRMQGAYVTEDEIERVVKHVAEQARPCYTTTGFTGGDGSADEGDERGALTDEDMEFYEDAKRLILLHQTGSSSLMMRKMKIAHPRAMRLMAQMEREGIVGPMEGPKPRRVLVRYADYYGEQPEGAVEDVSGLLDESERGGDGDRNEP